MKFIIISIVLICYTIMLLIFTSRSGKEITCSSCGQKYHVTPKRASAYMYLLAAVGLSIWTVLLDPNNDYFFNCLLAAAGLYYLFKKEGYKCLNCKTINQLP